MEKASIEDLWKKFDNKYQGVVIVSREARRILEAISNGEIEVKENPYFYALHRVLSGEVKVKEENESEK